ncbi:hypothetical protein JOC37_002028 [Desulfohalotomaculum tongense]|uniref:hypothetical protein n=1 Tax=Desulforadius tongensis TaxID=1216062 RepID=UPI00195BEC59|nr:hypothetical protein [Desulforadius tongensis]MBM7855626.1 hypothetical protein [Desulforadius tongensis]
MVYDKSDEKWLNKLKEENKKLRGKKLMEASKKYDRDYFKKKMEYCKEKYHNCQGKDAEKCRKHYKEKYLKYKHKYQSFEDKADGGRYDHGKKVDKNSCRHNYQCIMNLLSYLTCQGRKNC